VVNVADLIKKREAKAQEKSEALIEPPTFSTDFFEKEE
jgi:hypothetical protein